MTDPVAMTQLEVADYDLGIRGKLVRREKTHGPSSLAFCTIIYGLSLTDEVTETPFSNAANGYPDALLRVDESTRVDLPWRQGTDAVIADLTGADGRPLEMSPRSVLHSLINRYADLDLQPVLGFEYEVWLFETTATGEVVDTPRPHGRTENAYSLTRAAEIGSLATEFVNRMDSVGIEVEMFHAELGPGFFEFTLAPAAAVQGRRLRGACTPVPAGPVRRTRSARQLHGQAVCRQIGSRRARAFQPEPRQRQHLRRPAVQPFPRSAPLPCRAADRNGRHHGDAQSVRQLLQADRPGDVHACGGHVGATMTAARLAG